MRRLLMDDDLVTIRDVYDALDEYFDDEIATTADDILRYRERVDAHHDDIGELVARLDALEETVRTLLERNRLLATDTRA